VGKLKNLAARFAVCKREYGIDRREFGGKVARLRFWDVLIPRGKSKAYIEGLSAFICRDLEQVTARYANGDWERPKPKKTLEKLPVWVCWWQGEEAMPPIVKACVERLRRSLPDTAELKLITWDNYADYCDIPAHILEKHAEGIIGPAHLSDVLRFSLLSRYGGAWVDATVYVTGAFPEKLLTESFYTQRFESWDCCPQEACRGKWCGFFFGGKAESPVFSFMYEALCRYWSRFDKAVDYVFFDYILWAGYCGVPEIRRLIDAVPANNEHIWLMAKELNAIYDPAVFDELQDKNDFYKLSYKGDLQEQIQGQKTVYGHILEETR
jgi:hypothetical protein